MQTAVDKDTVAVGEQFTFTVVAEHNFFLEALIPTFDVEDDADYDAVRAQLGDLELLRIEHRGTGYFGASRPGVRADTIAFVATTFALDTAQVPALTIPFTSGTDTVHASSSAFTIPVARHLPEDASGIQDLAPLASFPAAWWPWIVAAFGTLLALALIWRALRAQEPAPPPTPAPKPAPTVSPYNKATRRLENLRHTTTLDDEAQIKPYFVQLVDILRQYLEERLGVEARELTTTELVRDMERRTKHGPFEGDIPERMRILLAQADHVKFAGEIPDSDTCRWAGDEAQVVLNHIEASFLPSNNQSVEIQDPVHQP